MATTRSPSHQKNLSNQKTTKDVTTQTDQTNSTTVITNSFKPQPSPKSTPTVLPAQPYTTTVKSTQPQPDDSPVEYMSYGRMQHTLYRAERNSRMHSENGPDVEVNDCCCRIQ